MIFKKFSDGYERRRFVRVDEPLPVKFKLLDRNSSEAVSEWKECNIRDISRGGACIQLNDVDEKLKEAITSSSNIFEFEMTLPAQKKIVAKGDIYYLKARGATIWENFKKEILEIGVKFIEISPEDENLIVAYIAEKYINKYGIWK
jgi:c-di-GMP-binding flagellar brake protein YcgR